MFFSGSCGGRRISGLWDRVGSGTALAEPSPEGLVCVAFLWNRLLTQLRLREPRLQGNSLRSLITCWACLCQARPAGGVSHREHLR